LARNSVSESPEAKAKVKERHAEAIAAFLKWREEYPKAHFRYQVRMFDMFIDAAKLKDMMK
jgi:hypothetical protein